jgi:hypothetical protein
VNTVEQSPIGSLVPPVPLQPFLELQDDTITADTATIDDDNEVSAVRNNILESAGGAEQCGFLHLVVDGIVFQTQVRSTLKYIYI